MKLKTIPEDFIVTEISKIPEQSSGAYNYFILKKNNYAWFKVQEILKKYFHVSEKDIGIAGIKDKHGITTQIISIKTNKPFLAEKYKHEDISIKYIHGGNSPISRGMLEGNIFNIIIRDILDVPKEKDWIINYFDEQRFSKNNIEIGLSLLKKDYKKACELIDTIELEGTDYIKALKKLSRSLISIYIHSFQSYLWNKIVSDMFEGNKINVSGEELIIPRFKPKQEKIPLIGFDTELEGEIGKKYEDLMKKFEIKQRDFVNRQITALICEGSERDLVKEVKQLQIGTLESDDICNNKKVKIQFDLEKGVYATMVVKQLMI